jgi:protein gp37
MAETTGISWAQSTFNIVWGCHEVPHDPACTHCYAREFSKRIGKDLWGKSKPRQRMSEHYWNDPLRWNKKASESGVRRRVFCSSMADVFEDHPDLTAPRERLWKLIDRTPFLDWMLLTKRPENMQAMTPPSWASGWPTNVWAGATAATQEWADKRCPILAEVPARVRWLSVEPMFGPIDLTKHFGAALVAQSGEPFVDNKGPAIPMRVVESAPLIHWVIVGGESGHGARPMKAEWVRSMIQQCKEHKVAFFFKQKGTVMAREMGCEAAKGDDPVEWPEEFKVQEFPGGDHA